MIQVESEVVQFLAQRPTPQQIIDFRPSAAATERFYALVAAERDNQLNDTEKHELDTYMYIEHLMRLLKAEAHRQ